MFRYENLLIRTLSETKYANFIERRILLRLDGEENRELVQFQYTDWACYGFPVNETLLDYQRRVAEALENSKSKGRDSALKNFKSETLSLGGLKTDISPSHTLYSFPAPPQSTADPFFVISSLLISFFLILSHLILLITSLGTQR